MIESSSTKPQNGKVTHVQPNVAGINSDVLPQKPPEWSLKAKVMAWAIAVSMLPVLAVGTVTYFSGQLLGKQINSARLSGGKGLEKIELALQSQLPLVLIGTSVTAVVSGAIAAMGANRTIRPILNAAAASTTVVNRLRQQDSTDGVGEKDELDALEANIKVIEEELPDVLSKQEEYAEPFQVFTNIVRRIQESLSSEEVQRTTVEEVRKAIRADRTVIFRFDTKTSGTVLEESVAPGLPKMLWSTIEDPCFSKYMGKYRQGYTRAIDNIYQAGLSDCYIGSLQRFAVKANLVAPIFRNKQLFGLLIAHQCSEPRSWQKREIDLFSQLAGQVGFALDYAQHLERVDAKADRSQVFIDVTRRIRQSLNEEEVLNTTVEEVRHAMRTDRAIVYGFDKDWYGTVIAESVVPGFPKALRAHIKDPCFKEGYVEKYQAGRVLAIDNIYEANLTDCYRDQLEAFAVKANLAAPILKDGHLFGLLIVHQCSGPRDWQQVEIDLFTQIAMQVGYALDHARLLKQVDTEAKSAWVLTDLSRRIRKSLNEEDVLNTTVEEVRKAMITDRALVYGFDSDWYGVVIAESVVPGFPKALRNQIKDPCFKQGYVDKYQEGRVLAIDNIYEAGLSECYLGQLEAYAVKANLVAPILKDGHLFGLLIVHQCSGPRDWQKSEIDLFTQIAMQVGYALDHARLFKQVDQSFQEAEVVSGKLSQQIRDSETTVEALLTTDQTQMESVTTTYNQIQSVANLAQQMFAIAQQVELHQQHFCETVQVGHQDMNRIVEGISALGETVVEADLKVKRLDQPSQKLSTMVYLISNVAAQIKLQTMNGFDGENVLTLARKLEADTTEIKTMLEEIVSEIGEVGVAIKSGSQQAIATAQLVREQEQKLNLIAASCNQITSQVEEITSAAAQEVQISTNATQSVIEVANISRHTSEQSVAVAQSLTKLAELAQELHSVVTS